MNIYSANLNISIEIDESPCLKMITIFYDFSAIPRKYGNKTELS
jgi:hypothetical protein